MNSDEIWLLQLWSGAFAAAGSGAVAVLVLYGSNRHQSKLAERARRQAAHLAEEQLAAQERSLRLQLDEQRAEAARARTVSAIADMLAIASDFPLARLEGFEAVKDLQRRAMSSALRWYVEDPSSAMSEILEWPAHLATLAIMCGPRATGSEVKLQFAERLSNDSSALVVSAAEWPSADAARRLALVKSLKVVREADADLLNTPVIPVP